MGMPNKRRHRRTGAKPFCKSPPLDRISRIHFESAEVPSGADEPAIHRFTKVQWKVGDHDAVNTMIGDDHRRMIWGAATAG